MMLKAENITFAYNERAVLEDFSLTLKPDDFTMLLGANGSGKSTVLKILGGYLAPQTGQLLCDGQPLANLRSFERARKIAVVSQIPPPILDFTVREMVSMGRLAHSSRLAPLNQNDIAAVENAMQKLEIKQFSSRPVSRLSGGERQRVLLAQALAQEPQYLLLDEPTSALDPAHAIALMRLLAEINSKVGILMVCHDLNLAWNYAKNIVILNQGRIALQGATRQILTAQNIAANFNCGAFIHPEQGIILSCQ
ncbi:MAG: ABC transporter ATP-binding protein [Lentisphaeria bacterium]|nr:ABC transporter ATP-binding protein [Lentisphaeria bacterium]